MMNNTLQ